MLLNRSTALAHGLQVLLRQPHSSDRNGLAELHERSGIPVTELELSRLLRVDGRQRAAVCATAWVGGTHALVGFAVAERGAAQPELLLAEDSVAPELAELLTAALFERARPADAA
jgi:hypothetical protein